MVDMQPSESRRSNVVAVADRRALFSAEASATASVVSTTSIVASSGASMPAPLAKPPTLQPSPPKTACLGTVSVVMTARAAASPPQVDRDSHGARRRRSRRRPIGKTYADQPGRADRDLTGPAAQQPGGVLGRGMRVLEALGAGAGVGTAGVEHDGLHLAAARTCWDQRTGAAAKRLRVNTPARRLQRARR